MPHDSIEKMLNDHIELSPSPLQYRESANHCLLSLKKIYTPKFRYRFTLAGAFPIIHWIKSKKTPRTRHRGATELTQTVTHSPLGSSESSAHLTCMRAMWDETHANTEHEAKKEKDKELNPSCCESHCATVLPPFTTFIHETGECGKNKTA